MRERTWFILLLVMIVTGLLVFTGCPNGATADTGGEEQFSFPGVLITILSAGDPFEMGDGTHGAYENADQTDTVTQTISYNFKMSKTEISNTQFQQFMDDSGYSIETYWTTNGWNWKTTNTITEPLFWTDSSFNGSNQPVVGVSWYEAVAFCNWLSDKEGLIRAYNSAGLADLTASGYRLPTEVEWEYATTKGASAEAERIYAYGNTWDSSKVVCYVGQTQTAAVGSKSPAGDTPQGLVDMSGNVWEWPNDNYQSDDNVAGETDRYNFNNDQTGTSFVLRGGDWNTTDESNFRAAFRYYSNPFNRNYDIGFRVVRP